MDKSMRSVLQQEIPDYAPPVRSCVSTVIHALRAHDYDRLATLVQPSWLGVHETAQALLPADRRTPLKNRLHDLLAHLCNLDASYEVLNIRQAALFNMYDVTIRISEVDFTTETVTVANVMFVWEAGKWTFNPVSALRSKTETFDKETYPYK